MKTILAAFLYVFGIVGTASAWAAAIVQSTSGDVRLEAGGTTSAVVAKQKIDSGATIQTGGDGQAILRFDDGQIAAISANTTFKIDDFRFAENKPQEGNIALSLIKGALRLVTGLVGQYNREGFKLTTSTATIGVRGTDFMVGIVNPTYFAVTQGTIVASNAAGTAAFAAGSTGMVASTTTIATSIAASALPASVSSAFSQLGSLSLTGAGTAGATTSGTTGASSAAGAQAGAQAATAAAAGGISAATVAAGALAVGAIASSVSNQSSSTTGTTVTTATTGTTGTQ